MAILVLVEFLLVLFAVWRPWAIFNPSNPGELRIRSKTSLCPSG